MKKFLAHKVNPDEIVLSNDEDLEEVYDLLDKDENFILSWEEDKTKNECSELMIASLIIIGKGDLVVE